MKFKKAILSSLVILLLLTGCDIFNKKNEEASKVMEEVDEVTQESNDQEVDLVTTSTESRYEPQEASSTIEDESVESESSLDLLDSKLGVKIQLPTNFDLTNDTEDNLIISDIENPYSEILIYKVRGELDGEYFQGRNIEDIKVDQVSAIKILKDNEVVIQMEDFYYIINDCNGLGCQGVSEELFEEFLKSIQLPE